MNVVVLGNQKFTGPADWSEITPKQFLQFLNWQIKLGGDLSGRYALLQLWYGIRYAQWRLLTDEQRVELSALLDFLDTRPERWLLPQIRVSTQHYIGPGDGLDFLTFGEFMHAQIARDRYYRNSSQTHLWELAAALYRPRSWSVKFWKAPGEAQRSAFVPIDQHDQSIEMSRLPETVLKGILLNYEGCLDQFPEQFPHLFPKTSSGGGDGGNWLDVGLSLARQTGALGSFHQMEQTSLFLVLTTLDSLMQETADLKKKYGQPQ